MEVTKYSLLPDDLVENSGYLATSRMGPLSREFSPHLRFYLRLSQWLCVCWSLVSLPMVLWLWRGKVPVPYSPAKDVLSYETHPLYFGQDPSFAGSPELVEDAWTRLLEPMNIRTTAREQEQARADMGEDVVRLGDGDYVSVLSVYHELHCLNALRMNIHSDYYYENITQQQAEYHVDHMIHCVDTIRRSLMCKADIALYTAYWIGNHTAFPNKELRSNSDTVCVDWSRIDLWARQRLLPKNRYKVKAGPFEEMDDDRDGGGVP